MESIRDKLRKIDALAASGVSGERDNARRLLEALCAKYGIDVDTIRSAERQFYGFDVGDDSDLTLFWQVVTHALQTLSIRNSRKGRTHFIEMTHAEFIDVSEQLQHYRAEWKQQSAILFTAFIHKHDLFVRETISEDSLYEPEHQEEPGTLRKVMRMMDGMETNQWQKKHKIER